MQLPESQELDTQYLGRLFDNTSQIYKFFWFQGILNQVEKGESSFSYEKIVDEMIVGAWYMVSEYHLNLGVRGNLERIVQYLHETTGIKPSEKKEVLLSYLEHCTDKEVKDLKKVLIKNVPYRLQAPFVPGVTEKDFGLRIEARIERLNQEKDRLMYSFGAYDGLHTRIFIRPEWMLYMRKNMEIIRGWLEYHMVIYLQKKNPNVPGIIEKLYPPQERKLDKVKKYWKLLIGMEPIFDIYGDNKMTVEDVSIDHFVPWSYVAHDELWNLHPTTKSINSSKSNKLPEWNLYFEKLAGLEFFSYEMMWKYDKVHEEFNKCSKEHLNSYEVRERLYRPGLKREEFKGQLSEILLPVYQSARNSGFGEWVYDNERQKIMKS